MKFSLLDLCPIAEDRTARDALTESLGLAQLAEHKGYSRYWIAEHHNMPGIASAATSVVIGYIAQGTQSIRVGAGGIMLPNHSPLQVAEQFGTLESLYPGRIDLGLGRAPGTDGATAYALRRNLQTHENQFPEDVMELLAYFIADQTASTHTAKKVHAIPGQGLGVPVWILGSSLYGAQLAAQLGLPYAFASHFAPADLMDALTVYRQSFQASEYLQQPYAMAGFNVFAADSNEEGQWLASSMQQTFIRLRTGTPGKLAPPVDDYYQNLNPMEQGMLDHSMSCSSMGNAETLEHDLTEFIERTQINEIILTGMIYDSDARQKSFAIAADVLNKF